MRMLKDSDIQNLSTVEGGIQDESVVINTPGKAVESNFLSVTSIQHPERTVLQKILKNISGKLKSLVLEAYQVKSVNRRKTRIYLFKTLIT